MQPVFCCLARGGDRERAEGVLAQSALADFQKELPHPWQRIGLRGGFWCDRFCCLIELSCVFILVFSCELALFDFGGNCLRDFSLLLWGLRHSENQ